jgi:hypothetical protein
MSDLGHATVLPTSEAEAVKQSQTLHELAEVVTNATAEQAEQLCRSSTAVAAIVHAMRRQLSDGSALSAVAGLARKSDRCKKALREAGATRLLVVKLAMAPALAQGEGRACAYSPAQKTVLRLCALALASLCTPLEHDDRTDDTSAGTGPLHDSGKAAEADAVAAATTMEAMQPDARAEEAELGGWDVEARKNREVMREFGAFPCLVPMCMQAEAELAAAAAEAVRRSTDGNHTRNCDALVASAFIPKMVPRPPSPSHFAHALRLHAGGHTIQRRS